MKKWRAFRITNTFDNSVVEISWDGISRNDAADEVLSLAIKAGKSKFDYRISEV
jgi:hypothetical protein